ncbi:MAG: DoxX family protein [Actinomycetota bacterium]
MSSQRKVYGVIWILAGTMHFLVPKRYRAIMPPYIPAHREMVLASGVAEVAGGFLLLTPGLEKPARWWLLAVLVGIFPANVHMALHPDDIKGLPPIPRWLLWARLPLQAVFAAGVVKATEK